MVTYTSVISVLWHPNHTLGQLGETPEVPGSSIKLLLTARVVCSRGRNPLLHECQGHEDAIHKQVNSVQTMQPCTLALEENSAGTLIHSSYSRLEKNDLYVPDGNFTTQYIAGQRPARNVWFTVDSATKRWMFHGLKYLHENKFSWIFENFPIKLYPNTEQPTTGGQILSCQTLKSLDYLEQRQTFCGKVHISRLDSLSASNFSSG